MLAVIIFYVYHIIENTEKCRDKRVSMCGFTSINIKINRTMYCVHYLMRRRVDSCLVLTDLVLSSVTRNSLWENNKDTYKL